MFNVLILNQFDRYFLKDGLAVILRKSVPGPPLFLFYNHSVHSYYNLMISVRSHEIDQLWV